MEGQGFNEGKGKPFTGSDFRFTTKGNLLYAIALGLPPDGNATIKSLALTSVHYPGQIADVKLVGYDHSLSYHRRSEALIIELPNDLPLQEAYCFKIIPA